MEKNLILALVLSFLLVIVWSWLFTTKRQQAPSKEELSGIKKETTTVPESAEVPVSKPAIPPKRDETIAPEIKEKTIKIETPLYEALFSNVGTAIKSFKLKKYHLTPDLHSPFIDLVKLEEQEADFLEIYFNAQSNPENDRISYQVDQNSISLDPESPPQDLTFRAVTHDGVSVNQTFRFYPDRYQIDLIVSLLNSSENQVEGSLEARLNNIPSKKQRYYSFVGVALLLNEKLEQIKANKMEEEKDLSGRIEWMAYEDGYFLTAFIPDDQVEGRFSGRLLPSGVLEAIYRTPSISLTSREKILAHFTLYFGPRDLSILKQLDKKLDMAINFGWTDIIAKPLLYALRLFYKVVNNYGVSIIILTILVKILFWPLTHKSYKSMKEMQKLQPHMAKIREKYKDNKQQMNKELMALYKTYKVNPMGSCLPMLIQIPVFFALYRVLGVSIELRHAPFMLWINDLSAPDRLFSFPFQIPYMSPPYGIPVLTLLMGASMFIQQRMTPTPGDPTQAKMMMFMPIFFTFLFINFPSGLVLYWLVNNILTIGQQYRIKRSAA